MGGPHPLPPPRTSAARIVEKASALWGQILEMDGAQLTSAEIKRQQTDIASGKNWLRRTMKHLNTIAPEEQGRGETLTTVMALCSELTLDSQRLREAQQKHQRLHAEKLALQALGAAS